MSGGLPAGWRSTRPLSTRIDRLSEGRFAVIATAPGLLLVALLVIPPLLAAIGLSLFRIDLLKDTASPFIALRNYMTRMPADGAFLASLPVTIAFAAAVTVVAVPLAFGSALMINGLGRLRGPLTVLLLLPWAIAPVADAALWALLAAGTSAPISGVLKAIGLPGIVVSQAPGALVVMLLAAVWRAVPLLAVLFLGALRQVPGEIDRAARMDGASRWQAFRFVTLPALRPIVIAACLIQLILALQTFDIQYSLFRGRPPAGTELSVPLIQKAVNGNFVLGYGAAMTVVLGGVIALTLVGFYALFGRSRESRRPRPVPTVAPVATASDVDWAGRRRTRPRIDAAAAVARRGLRMLAIGLLALWLVGPIVWIVGASVLPDRNSFGAAFGGPALQLRGFQAVLGDAGWRDALLVSVTVASIGALLAFVVAAFAAYPLARYRLPGTRLVLGLLLGTQLIPPIALAIPMLFLFIRLDLRNSVAGLILVNAAFWAPVLVWLVRGAILSVPPSLEAAARIDGLSRIGAIFRITLRTAGQPIAAALALIFVGIWNDFVFANVLGGRDTFTVARFLAEKGTGSTNVLGAMIVLTAGPCVLLIALLRPWFVGFAGSGGAVALDRRTERRRLPSLRPRVSPSRAVAVAGAVALAVVVIAVGLRAPAPNAAVGGATEPNRPRPPAPTPVPTPYLERGARLEAVLARHGIKATSPGCGVAISDAGRVVYERGFGLADVEAGIPMMPTTVVDVASVSKQFTAAALLLLVGEGRVALDDDIHRYLPELPDYGKPVRLSDLLYHISGLVDLLDAVHRAGFDDADRVTTADVLAAIAAVDTLSGPPGVRFVYNSTNYTLLRLVVERVARRPFAEFVEQRIFRPLGMRGTSWDSDTSTPVPGRAVPYRAELLKSGAHYVPYDFKWDVVGTGGLQTNALDLLRWAANFQTNAVGGPGLLKRQLLIGGYDGVRAYAGGLRVWSHKGQRFYLHGGGWSQSGFRAALLMDLDRRVAVALTCNLAHLDPYALGFDVYDAWLGGP